MLFLQHHPFTWCFPIPHGSQRSQRRGPYFARHSSAKPPPKLRARSLSCSFSWLPRKMCTCHGKLRHGWENLWGRPVEMMLDDAG